MTTLQNFFFLREDQVFCIILQMPALSRTALFDYQFLFKRTRLLMSDAGFFVTIHSMMVVARDKLYLRGS